MTKTTEPLSVDEARRIADDLMASTLRRAQEGRLRRGEAESAATLLRAVDTWSGMHECSDLVDKAIAILALGKRLQDQRSDTLTQVLEKTKVAVRTAVGEAVAEAMRAQLTKANRQRKAPSKR